MKGCLGGLWWEIWRRYRWGFALVGISLLVAVGLTAAVSSARQDFDEARSQLPGVQDAAPSTGGRSPDKAGAGGQEMKRFALRRYDEAEAEVERLSMRVQAFTEIAGGVGVTGLGSAVLALMVIFAGAEPSRVRGFTGIPPRRFVLPVTTSQLIFWPIIFGPLLLFALWRAWWHCVFHPLYPDTEIWLSALDWMLPAALVWFVALVWALPSFPKLRVAALMLEVLGLALGLTMCLEPPGWLETNPSLSWAGPAALAGIVAAGVATAWVGVAAERRGGWPEAGWIRRWRARQAARAKPRGEFASAFRAQVWLEWRRNLRAALWVWAASLALLVVLMLWMFWRGAEPSSAIELSDILFLGAVMIWSAVVGLNIARDGSGPGLATSSFVGTRPLGIQGLLVPKFVAGMLGWLSMWGLTLLTVAGVGIASGHAAEFVRLFGSAGRGVAWLGAGFLSLHVVTGILPLCLTGRMPGFPWSMVPLLVLYWVAFGILRGFDLIHDLWTYATIMLALFVVAKLTVAAIGFRWAVARRLVDRRYVTSCVAVWLIGIVFASGAWLLWFHRHMDGADFETAIIPAAIAVVPLARLAWAPLALSINRNR